MSDIENVSLKDKVQKYLSEKNIKDEESVILNYIECSRDISDNMMLKLKSTNPLREEVEDCALLGDKALVIDPKIKEYHELVSKKKDLDIELYDAYHGQGLENFETVFPKIIYIRNLIVNEEKKVLDKYIQKNDDAKNNYFFIEITIIIIFMIISISFFNKKVNKNKSGDKK